MVDSNTQSLSDGGALQATDVIYGVRPGAPAGSRDFKFTGANVGAGGGSLDQVARDNTAVNRFHIAINGALSVGEMVDGVTDVYTDETGVDLVASLNENYDAVDDFYTNNAGGVFGSDLTTQAQAIADSEGFSTTDDMAFDDNGVTKWNSATVNPNIPDTAWIGQDFGASNDKIIRRVSIDQNVGGGTNNIFGTDSLAIESSPDNSVWTEVALISPIDNDVSQNFDIPVSPARRYWRVLAKINPPGSSAGGAWGVDEIEMREAAASGDLTLISQSITALAQPTDARVIVLQEDGESGIVLADMEFAASRDGGTTFTTGTISEIQASFEGSKCVLAADVDVSGQPAGTDMEYRIRTTTGKIINVHAVSLMWS